MVSRETFNSHAKPIEAQINGSKVVLDPKNFSTGSLGWNCNQKMQVQINGEYVTCQLGLNLTIVGSKELPK